MSKKYKELAPTISALITKTEIKAKKTKITEETSPINYHEQYTPTLTKQAVEVALEYIRWLGASSIPWEYKKYYNNGPQDIAVKVCMDLGDKYAITEEQVRTLYSEWKMIESSDLEDPIEEPTPEQPDAIEEDPAVIIFDEPAKVADLESAKAVLSKSKKSKKSLN